MQRMKQEVLNGLLCILAIAGSVLQWEVQGAAKLLMTLLAAAVLTEGAAHVRAEKRIHQTAWMLGFLLAAFLVVGREINRYETIERLITMSYLPKTALRFAGMTVLMYSALKWILHVCVKPHKPSIRYQPKLWMIWLAIFVCWIPYLIVFYPGCLSFDSLREINILLGLEPLSNHHPIIHQWTMAPFVWIGQTIGSLETGIAMYSLFQMAAMSLIYAVAIHQLGKRGLSLWLQILLIAFYGLNTINAFYSITAWKDILFGGFTLLLMLVLTKLSCEDRQPLRFWLGLTALLFLFSIYRNNGYYVFLLALPLYLLFNRKVWKPLLAVAAAVVVLVNSYQFLIFDILGAKESASGEMLSVPMQQIARTLMYHRDSVTEEEQEILSEVFTSLPEVRRVYHPHLADHVKDLFLSEVFDENPGRYLRVWLKIGLRNPIVYVDAFLYQCHGYWYPDVPYQAVWSKILNNTLGLSTNETAATAFLRETHLALEASKLPGLLYRPATFVWLVLLALAILICKRRSKLAAPMLFLLGLWLTTLLSPVYAETRYLYGVMVSAPIYLGIALTESPQKDKAS
ncbi:MAG: hypothetical protein J6K55_06420 [Clostridia bacterium]|nr:hypothetical protein [Clostridia bacterium]